jgi:hypothetical protein
MGDGYQTPEGRGVVCIQMLEHSEDKQSRKWRMDLLRDFGSAEVKRLPQFRKRGAVIVEVDVEEYRRDRKREGKLLFSINAEGTDFGENIDVGPPLKKGKRAVAADEQGRLLA